MTTFRTLALATLATAGLFGPPPTPAQAAPQSYVAGVIRNNTPFTMNYEYQLNKGAWVRRSLRPGEQHVYSLRWPQAGANNVILVRFDCVPSDGNRVTLHTQSLAMHGTTDPNKGWLQCFIVTNSGKNIALAR